MMLKNGDNTLQKKHFEKIKKMVDSIILWSLMWPNVCFTSIDFNMPRTINVNTCMMISQNSLISYKSIHTYVYTS